MSVKRSSIRDVAKEAGVSTSTVSRVLSGVETSIPIGSETRERVILAAQALGYFPSAIARNLRQQRTNRIALLLAYAMSGISEYVSKLITGVIQAVEPEGYSLTLLPLLTDRLDRLSEVCRAREVDGLLLIDAPQIDKIVTLLMSEAMPFMAIGMRLPHPEAGYVNGDSRAGCLAAMRHLLTIGHKRIAFVDREDFETTSQDRLGAYRSALEEAGIGYDPNLVVATPVAPGSAFAAASALLDLPSPPTAICGVHDIVAIEALQAAKSRGLSVPEDVAIVGYDDLYSAAITDPPLTTVRPPLTEIGRLGAEALIRRIGDDRQEPVRLLLPVELVIRGSTTRPL